MSIFVKKPGLSTTVQDLGRTGFLSSGFSPNGVMDRHAARIANILVGNNQNASVLEFVLAGPTLRFTKKTYVALAGADFQARVNGEQAPLNQAFEIPADAVLECGAAHKGMFGYLAFAGGGLDVPSVMGSASTNLKCGIGGWHGRALAYGDCIPLASNLTFLANLPLRTIPAEEEPAQEADPIILRVIPGPQENLFTEQGVETFYGQRFSTTSQSDRMGFRLEGPAIETRHGSDIASDGIAFGAVQVPARGKPIIMLADRQTTGGYAKIGTVASVDLPKLVQCRPGREIRFQRINVQEAQALYREEERTLLAYEHVLQNPGPCTCNARRAAAKLGELLKQRTENNPLWLKQALVKEHPWT